MKKSDLFFAALRVPVDFIMILAAGIAAYVLRFQALIDVRPVVYQLPIQYYFILVILCAIFSIFILALSGLYAIRRWKTQNEIQRIIISVSAAIMLLIVVIFFRQEYFSSRFVVLAMWILMIFMLSVGRMCIRLLRAWCFLNGIGLHAVALVGSSGSMERTQELFNSQPSLGYKIVAMLQADDPTLHTKLEEKKKNNCLDEILAVGDDWSKDRIARLVDSATLLHVDIGYSADMIGVGRLQQVMIAGMPFVEVRKTLLSGWWRIFKRFIDFLGAFLAIIFFLPCMALIALLIKITSKGPVIYKDIRVGQHGLFKTYKFRTMHATMCTGPGYDETGAAEKLHDELMSKYSTRVGPVPKVANDPRRTHFGRFLEATSLDELPQFFNVLIGNMSLVGPRPHRPKEVAGYNIMDHKLFSVKPGITGLAQISGRSDLDFSEEVRLDLYYIENWSFMLDCIILLKTPIAVIMRRSPYTSV